MKNELTKKKYREVSSIGFVPKGQFSKKLKIAFVVVCMISLLIGSFLGYTLANPGMSQSTIIEEGSMVETASYVVWLDGSTYYAKNGITGAIDYSGTNATTVIQNTIDAISTGLIVLKDMRLPLAVTLKEDVTVREIYKGKIFDYPFPPNVPPMTEYLTVANCFTGVRDDYYVARNHKGNWVDPSLAMGSKCKISKIDVFTSRTFGFGSYQFKYYHTGNQTGKIFVVGFALFGACTFGGIYFEQKGDGSLITVTSDDTNVNEQAISGWNPNSEATLKIEWASNQVKFYVDGAVKNTHTLYISPEPLHFGLEIEYGPRSSDWDADGWQYLKDFRRAD